MSDTESKSISRRGFLKGVAVVAGLATVPLAGIKEAQAKVPKSSLKYQDHPHGKAECHTCQHFIPGKSPTAMGTCNLVAGAISPKGWCLAYVQKG